MSPVRRADLELIQLSLLSFCVEGFMHFFEPFELTHLKKKKKNFRCSLTVSPVELGEAGGVAAGQLGGAPEGRRRQAGKERAVAVLCREKRKGEESQTLG